MSEIENQNAGYGTEIKKSAKVFESSDSPMTVKNWLVVMLLLCIPIVNLILMIVWSVKSDINKNVQTLMRAYWILAAVVIVIYIIIFAVIAANGGFSTSP